MNPNAAAKWLADVEKWRADLGVTYEHLAYEMGFWNVEGSYAYAVISGTLTVTIKDQSVVRTGTLDANRGQTTRFLFPKMTNAHRPMTNVKFPVFLERRDICQWPLVNVRLPFFVLIPRPAPHTLFAIAEPKIAGVTSARYDAQIWVGCPPITSAYGELPMKKTLSVCVVVLLATTAAH